MGELTLYHVCVQITVGLSGFWLQLWRKGPSFNKFLAFGENYNNYTLQWTLSL